MKRLLSSLLLSVFAASQVYSQIPTITSFTPPSGAAGTIVSITGTNFGATPSNNIVYFGAVKASVNSASATQLIVKVPVSSSYAPISATVNGLTGYSPTPFMATFAGGNSLSTSSFSPKINYATGTLPYGVALGDLDGDGKPDLVVTNYNSNTISVFRNTNTGDSILAGSFAPGVVFAAGSHPWGIALGDLDGDGKPDIVASNGTSGTLSVFRNTSVSGSITPSSFAVKVDFATGGSGYGVAIADLDGDGRPDIVATNRNASTVSVLRNTGTIGTITGSSFAANVDFSTGNLPYGVAVSDLDGDGKLDLVVANSGSGTLSVIRNTSTSGSITSSSFSAKVDFTPSGTPIAVAICDVNGDGKPDIASANTGDSTIAVMQNTSTGGSITSGSFAAAIDFKLGGSPNSIAVGDFNGDAKPDLAVTNANGNTISLFQNTNSTGSAISVNSFASKVDFSTASAPYGLAVGDLDGDGRPDVVVTNSSDNTVSVLQSVDGAPSISVNKITVDFGYVARGDSSSQVLVIRNTSINTLLIDTIYANRKEISPSITHGSVTDSLQISLLFRADTMGLFTDSVFIRSNAITSLVRVPVTSRVYSRPGSPASCSVTPAGWSNAAAFTITWTNLQSGILSVNKIWYSIDTLPRNAAVLKSQSVTGTSAAVSISQVGKHVLYFFLEDSLGNKNQDSVGSVIIKFDNIGPAITQNNTTLDTIFVQPDGTLSNIPAIISSATEPANESGVTGMKLLYRRIDEQTWTSLDFPGVTSSSLTVPASSFIKNGTVIGAEYRIQAIDSGGNSSFSNLLSFEVRYAPDLTVSNFADIPSVHLLNLPEGQEVKAYRLFSLPYELENRKPNSFMEQSFGTHSDQGVPYAKWRMARLLNGGWDYYDSFKDSSVVVPGSGFFVVSKDQGKSATLSKPKLVRSDKMLYTGIKLNQGWNLVGNPFLVAVPFDHLIFEGGNHLAHYYFSGTGAQGGWEGSGANVDTLKSWQGWAIKVDSAATLRFNLTGIVFPAATGSSKLEYKAVVETKHSKKSKEWTLEFDAVRDDIKMSCLGTEIGMQLNASRGYDESDRLQAPFVGSRNILVSTQNEAGPLVKDMRPFTEEGDTWDLTVMTGDGNATANLTFGSLDGLSDQGFEASLADLAKGLAYDLKKQKTIRVVTGKDGMETYRLIVGTRPFIEKNLGGIALIPNEPKLYNNYPNPFNPETIIRYAVPRAMPGARVLLKVYNDLGQEVRTLVNQEVTPGFYEVSFDGKDLSSGPYFMHISITSSAATYHDTKKMLLIR